jgi:transaldolase
MIVMMLARTLRDLYDPEQEGTAFAIDGFVPDELLRAWLGKGVIGQTSNQTLFLQCLQEGALDDAILRLHQQGLSPADIFNCLYNAEVTKSAEALARWANDEDHLGVSRETDALRANDPEAVISEAIQIQRLSPRIFVKLANVGTPEQVRAMIAAAMVRAFREGIPLNPNITLVFGAHHYLNTVAGYLDGLMAITDLGGDPTAIRSVNSLFVSRLDVATDELIERQQQTNPAQRDALEMLKGKAGIAHAKFVYRLFCAIFFGEPLEDASGLLTDDERQRVAELNERWRWLKERFPRLRVQRLLLASTGNKKPGVYSELLYVLPLLGPHLANTLPLKTLEALERFLSERGIPKRATIWEPLPWMVQNSGTIRAWEEAVIHIGSTPTKSPDEVLRLLHEQVYAPQGTSLRRLTDELRDKGAEAFARDQRRAYELFAERIATLTGAQR